MKLFVSLLFICFTSYTLAQNSRKADSLLNIVNTTGIDTIKVKTLNELAKFHMNSEPSKPGKFFKSATKGTRYILKRTGRKTPGIFNRLCRIVAGNDGSHAAVE